MLGAASRSIGLVGLGPRGLHVALALALAAPACDRAAARAADAAADRAPAASATSAPARASTEPLVEDLAILAPLAVGATFPSWGEPGRRWTVERFARSASGTLDVLAMRETEEVVFSVCLAGDGPEPPAKAGRYAVYYRVKKSRLTGDFAARAARGLASVLDRNADVAAPGWLRAYQPGERPVDPL